MLRHRVCAFARFFLLIFVAGAGSLVGWSQAVTTYHYDTYRTGWNSHETTLTPANVNSQTFGMLYSVPLDDQVDSQPLYMPSINITAGSYQGVHNVVYVAAESNTIYAIDAESGTILLSPNFGTPVPYPLGCNNNGPNVGINSTPVIDPASQTLYVLVYTQQDGNPVYMVHALDLGSLTDKVAPQLVTASHLLSDGTVFNFNATYQRQRPGLLLANRNIYAGFGSFCDFAANLSRGWLLGWQTGSLMPLASNDLFDAQANSPNDFFLSSIWMSGYGLAEDDSGNILAVTGNSDYSGTTYDGVTNIQESVIKVSPNLSGVIDLFTPSDWSNLDNNDSDFGSGGVMVLPDQGGSYPHLAVAAGKEGNMFFMNEDSLGGYSSQSNNVLGTYFVGGCWCGPSYFVDSDSIARVVSSGGTNVYVWQLQTSPTPSLNMVSQSSNIVNGQNGGGFFTSVSSNGTSNPIIWVLSRAATGSSPIYLEAFNPDSVSNGQMKQLYSAAAGSWPNNYGNSNLVPMVASGRVFVASYGQLRAYGLTGKAVTTTVLTPSVNPSNYGQPVTLTAQVSTTGSTTPTGTVTFKNGSTSLGSATLVSGIATLTKATLPVGTQSLTATYNGDGLNAVSTSTVLAQQVNQAVITISLASTPNPSPQGASVKFTATLASNGGLPTGTITFSYNGTELGTGTIAAGRAIFSTTTLPAGADVVTAAYAGTIDYSATSSPETQVVDGTTTVLTSSLNPSNYGQSVTLTAQVTTTGSTTPTGTVTFKNGTTLLGSETLNASGIATLTKTTLPVGTNSLTASYNGDSLNGKSTSSVLMQQVNQAALTLSLASTPNPSPSGASVKFTATLSSNGGLPTGTVTFSLSGTTIGTAPIAAGKATFFTTTLPAGADVVTSAYAGTADYSAASSSVTQIVNGTTTVLSPSLNPSNYGQSVTLTAQVTTTGSTTPTGTVTFKNGTSSLGSGTLNSSGFATFTTTTLPVGTDSLTASYNGDSLNGKSTSGAVMQQVNQAAITMSLTSTPNSSKSGQSVRFTAKMTSTGGLPTGTVTFSYNGTTLGTGTISDGTSSFSTTTLPSGSDLVTATYAGDTDYSSASASVTQVVN